ncbi:MAG: response regulator transcription factor [Hymenobacter sp.]|nr:MAG: response regulator transcription factor [Hymenobacter sp.]
MADFVPYVLVVEDSPTQARLVSTCLLQLGLALLGPAATAGAALALCKANWPALAIIDLNLEAGNDGVELARQLQQTGPIPFIFISATDDTALLARARAMQPLAILPKPFTITSLRRMIEMGMYGQARTPLDWQPPAGPESAAAPWLFVRERDVLMRLALADITCVRTEQKHAVITLVSGRRHSVRTPLAELLLSLPATFVQVHRSWLVNLNYIEYVDPVAGIIRLPGAIEAPLGRTYRDELLSRLPLIS